MLVRIDIDPAGGGAFGYRVSQDAEELYGDDGLATVVDCLVAAIEGLPPEVLAVELRLDRIVSGTYPLQVIAMNVDQVAQHALNTTAMIDELMPDR